MSTTPDPLAPASGTAWPELPTAGCSDTLATLHRWTQIIGKIRMELTPHVNHWWHVALYITSRGLTTSPIPYEQRTFQIDFDFVAHELAIVCSDGTRQAFPLRPLAVADFYHETMEALKALGIEAKIWPMLVEIPNPVRVTEDYAHAAYDPECAQRLWRVLVQSERVFTRFRSRFIGKTSPVHFFWGAFDLALTRFSGRTAPQHPGVPNVGAFVMHDAYSHEVSSCGFWPGDAENEPIFYSYAYPEPEGFKDYAVEPAAATYSTALGEFVLPYEAVRRAPDPDAALFAFLQSTYEAAANLAQWDRAALEREA
jgi:hypothetical protein